MPIQRFKHIKTVLVTSFLFFNLNGFGCDTTQTVKCKTYFSDGSLKTIKSYKNGLRHGTWIVKNEKGNIILKTRYKKGKRRWQFTYEKNVETIDRKGRVRHVKDCGC